MAAGAGGAVGAADAAGAGDVARAGAVEGEPSLGAQPAKSKSEVARTNRGAVWPFGYKNLIGGSLSAGHAPQEKLQKVIDLSFGVPKMRSFHPAYVSFWGHSEKLS